MEKPVTKQFSIVAKSRYDIEALIKVRQALESGWAEVRVAFLSGAAGVIFRQGDLPGVRQKILFGM